MASKRKLFEKVKNLKEKLLDKITDSKEKLFDKVKNLKEKLLDKTTDLKEKLFNKVKNLKEKLTDKITDSKEKFLDKMKDLNDKLRNKRMELVKILGLTSIMVLNGPRPGFRFKNPNNSRLFLACTCIWLVITLIKTAIFTPFKLIWSKSQKFIEKKFVIRHYVETLELIRKPSKDIWLEMHKDLSIIHVINLFDVNNPLQKPIKTGKMTGKEKLLDLMKNGHKLEQVETLLFELALRAGHKGAVKALNDSKITTEFPYTHDVFTRPPGTSRLNLKVEKLAQSIKFKKEIEIEGRLKEGITPFRLLSLAIKYGPKICADCYGSFNTDYQITTPDHKRKESKREL